MLLKRQSGNQNDLLNSYNSYRRENFFTPKCGDNFNLYKTSTGFNQRSKSLNKSSLEISKEEEPKGKVFKYNESLAAIKPKTQINFFA